MSSSKTLKKLTLFDLDHTLLPLDSDYAWGTFTTTLGWTDADEFARQNDVFYAHYQAGTLDIHDYVRFATRAVKNHGAIASIAARDRFMREIILPAIKPQARALVDQHQQAGDEVLIITATNEFVTRPIADVFGVRELIAVELEHEPPVGSTPGWITGEIRGIASFREGKVSRIKAWLDQQGLAADDVEITFYTDSMNDLPLLEIANHPVATNPDARLRSLAQSRGWRILDLF
jgi:HAD superfamily hydrolase (TIGR01490 family)